MDKVRLGRALGQGTRHAAKTLVAVAEAAAAPDPRRAPAAAPAAAQAGGSKSEGHANAAAPGLEAKRPGERARSSRGRDSVRVARRTLFAPLATFSAALSLRVTGLFFGLMATVMVGGAWRRRDALQHHPAATGTAGPFWLFVGLAALFGYFAFSSFLRAARRERA